MRYIKLFEDVNKLFWEVTKADFYSPNYTQFTTRLLYGTKGMYSFNPIPFTKSDIDKLEELCFKVENHPDTSDVSYAILDLKDRGTTLGSGTAQEFSVYRIYDNYYMLKYMGIGFTVIHGVKYYKCDDFEGLLDCLKIFGVETKMKDINEGLIDKSIIKSKKLFEDLSSDYEEIPVNVSGPAGTPRSSDISIKPSDKDYKVLSKFGFEKWHAPALNNAYLGKRVKKYRTSGTIITAYEILIYTYKDEWYVVRKSSKSGRAPYTYNVYKDYRCDQIDGVLNCLKNEFGIE